MILQIEEVPQFIIINSAGINVLQGKYIESRLGRSDDVGTFSIAVPKWLQEPPQSRPQTLPSTFFPIHCP